MPFSYFQLTFYPFLRYTKRTASKDSPHQFLLWCSIKVETIKCTFKNRPDSLKIRGCRESTMQKYELFLKLPNNFGIICIKCYTHMTFPLTWAT